MKPKKICSVESCRGYVFARNLCPFHYRASSSKPIAKASSKRKQELVKYSISREEFIEKSRDKNGNIFCIFCNRLIYGEPDIHHGLGRDNDLLLDIKFWFTAHNKCHVDEYHSLPIDKIPWWPEYLKRIENLCEEVFLLELNKVFKNERNK